MIFVFGKRASKMRTKVLEELIHNSVDHPKINYCSVDVYFEELVLNADSKAWEVKPDCGFSIGRSVQKEWSSHAEETVIRGEYNICGFKETMENVKKKLAAKDLDLVNNRFMILQGEVEQIAIMQPTTGKPEAPGLLEYLEEIIGTNKYVEKISKLEEEHSKKVETRKGKTTCQSQGQLLSITSPNQNWSIIFKK